ncbi:MAG: restriction endonuclease [Mesorhizobium sp.]|uniref:DNA methyltransferase n=1 Tax=Mesorhizobium sp. TaxID=1871066 RepID=UPI000FE53334|nr:DNA methyltransferase [Mesorhizobium sp.]RWM96177.1 MAG: restriction endonuclease [Mesorhizobium sp.]
MSKDRIVVETTNQKKAALVQALELQGDTLTDWLEEQLTLSVPDADSALGQGINSISEIEDSGKVWGSLKALDWAFTDDDTRYLTHDLHPYPAKFIPQIPANLIAALSVPGDVVFDPFGGSGTTAVEAVRLGRRALSLDANPLSRVIGRVKTGFMTPAIKTEIDQLQATVTSYVASPEFAKAGWREETLKRHRRLVPDIPNIEKWFHPNSIAELALLRFLIAETTSGLARDAGLLALSRIILKVSFQESETRYVSEPRDVSPGLALRGFAESLRTITRRLEHSAADFHRADARFLIGDSRTSISSQIGDGSVDLIVTSPPYPNATDYHLYHRFRLFWLGFDPKDLASVEIGSHLKHQRTNTGFEDYVEDMKAVLAACHAALQPGRFAVFIVGDAVFKGENFSTSDAIVLAAEEVGFERIGVIDRPIHDTKRSFAQPARRARNEQLVVLRKPNVEVSVKLVPPAYRMWDFEVQLRRMEIETLAAPYAAVDFKHPVEVKASLDQLSAIRRLTFSSEFIVSGANPVAQPTWQKVLENGEAGSAKRKDPKYGTHGLHPYKGKFYPQLAKALVNISGIKPGSSILDPFCGSGTVLLEGMLNGYAAFGCDMNPLAAKIARAKTQVFSVDRSLADHALSSLLERVKRPPARFKSTRTQFKDAVLRELDSWFASPVLDKMEWLLSQIRLFGDPRLVEFGEVVLSSIIREISQQDPADLRIRRRKEPLVDAPVIELFTERLSTQLMRLRKYWAVAGRQPGEIISPTVEDGDSRNKDTFCRLGLVPGTVDCVVTSPPYATALPYIDTDRLSLMAIMGIESLGRSALEGDLTGSREIRTRVRTDMEAELLSRNATSHLPDSVVRALRKILKANRNGDVGFRRLNMAALLWRYFCDMSRNIAEIKALLRPGAKAFYVVGNSRTKAGENWSTIDTCGHILEIARMLGLEARTLIDISVTTENYNHIRNAITDNAVLEFQRPSVG